MGQIKSSPGTAVLAASASAFYAGGAAAAARYNLQEPVTKAAADIYDLHTLMFWICVGIFIVVFGAMFYSVYAHRRSVGHEAAQFHENTSVEVFWTVIPLLILVAIAWPATKTLLGLRNTTNPDITIKATGYQWKWGYDYLKGEGEGISFLANLSTPQEQIVGDAPKGENYLLEADQHLVVPVGKKIRILTTANDVIHSWWVPALGIKQDAIPGFVRDAWFRAEKEGIYRGQCAELCGKDHGFMPIVVEVLAQDKYSAWVATQKQKLAAAADDPNKSWDLKELMTRGEKLYPGTCGACHQAGGQGVANAFPPLTGSKVVLGPKAEQIDIVLHGRKGVYRPNTVMPPQAQMSDTDIAAVITYTRNSWGNKAGENIVQPAEVKAARK